MQRSKRRQTGLIIVLLLTLTACSSVFGPGATPTPLGAFQLSSNFRNLYERLGGEPILGKAISTTFNYDGGIVCQYTANVLFCYNSTKTEAERVSLVPLGTLLYPPVPGQQFTVYEGFQAMYNSLFGQLYVGKPLSGILYNKEKRRLEQYFENMGFYQLIDDPRATVHLLAYGSYSCAEYCTYLQADFGTKDSIPVIALVQINRLGGIAVFGAPLSQPYVAADGSQEQLLDNVLVYVPKDNPSGLGLRPLAKMMGIRIEAPERQPSRQNPGTIFYPVGEGVGYEVPVVFDQFIALHGGREISGQPTSSAFSIPSNSGQMAGQCFTNYCLYYNPEAAAGSRVGLMNLGSQYFKQMNPEVKPFEFSPETTRLILSEKKTQVTSSEGQVIQVKVVQKKDLKPISNVASLMVVGMPDGSKPSYSLPPTDLKGNASYTLPPVKNAKSGTMIPYVVCLNVPSTSIICQADSYLIWNIR
jgi:hypothetical protein